MLKDLGNQKLPRFKAGAPLLEQVTGTVALKIGTL